MDTSSTDSNESESTETLLLIVQLDPSSPLARAVAMFVGRQDRVLHPDGRFDSGGRWFPRDNEHRECCDVIRSPSRSYPWSYMVHCRTAVHVATLHGVDVRDIRRVVRLQKKMSLRPADAA